MKNPFWVLTSAILVVLIVLQVIGAINTGNARSLLEGQGYVVFAAGEYTGLNAKIDALKTSADLARDNAVIAADAAQDTLTILRLHTENMVYLFPDVTNVSITLTAPATANTWGNWTEIAGNDSVTLSSKFTGNNSGYLSQITCYGYNFTDELCIIELAYDDDNTDVVGRVFVRSDWTYVMELNSAPIPGNSTIYYRMMSSHINETLKANFKYYYD